MTKRAVWSSLFLLGMAGALTAAEARPGAVPIYRPTTITAPGTYVVTRDISATNASVITIASDDVTIDLNGHTLRSTGMYGVIFANDGYRNVTIENGRVAGGDYGIYFASGSRHARITLRRLTVFDSGQTGVWIAAAHHVDITECHVHDTGANGLSLGGSTNTFAGRVSNNVVERVGQTGISVYGMRGGEIAGNVISLHGSAGSSAAGLSVSGMSSPQGGGLVIRGNSIVGDGVDDRGISIDVYSPDNLIVGNTITRNGGTAIELKSMANRVSANTISRNGVGIMVTGPRNFIDGNLFDTNVNADLYFEGTTSTGYRDNVIDGFVVGTGLDLGGNS